MWLKWLLSMLPPQAEPEVILSIRPDGREYDFSLGSAFTPTSSTCSKTGVTMLKARTTGSDLCRQGVHNWVKDDNPAEPVYAGNVDAMLFSWQVMKCARCGMRYRVEDNGIKRFDDQYMHGGVMQRGGPLRQQCQRVRRGKHCKGEEQAQLPAGTAAL